MANRTPRAGKLQPKIVARLCNQLLEGSGMIIRDWQLDATNPAKMDERFTLELQNGGDWQPVPGIYAFHEDLIRDAAKNQA